MTKVRALPLYILDSVILKKQRELLRGLYIRVGRKRHIWFYLPVPYIVNPHPEARFLDS